MKFRRRFSLRTLLLLITVNSIPLGWSSYQLDWIRQRHAFLETNQGATYVPFSVKSKKLPWSLRLFGERPQPALVVSKADMEKARLLFPEATVFERDDSPPFTPYFAVAESKMPAFVFHPEFVSFLCELCASA